MERELVERAMAGDHDAFGALAHEVAGRLFVVARLILHDDAEAEDATQDALFMAWRHIRGLRDPDRFDAWVRRLLVNACYRRASTAGRRARIQIGLRAIRSEPDASARLADRDEIERGWLLDPSGGAGQPTAWRLPGTERNAGWENVLTNVWQRLPR